MNVMRKPKPEAAKNTAKRRGPSLLERLVAWRDLHLFSFVSSFGRIAQRPFSTAMTVGVIAIALALPLCFSVLLVNVEQLSGSFRESRDFAFPETGTCCCGSEEDRCASAIRSARGRG